jgi:molybdate transport system substrate-binding protein
MKVRFLLLSVIVSIAAVGQSAPLTVSAAISLTDALEAIAREYAASGGGPVRFNFAGSNTLARQLVNGAPADLFISADDAQMDVAAQAGVIDPTSRVNLLRNHLALVTRHGGPRLTGAADLARAPIQRIAIGDPSAVPAGVYARSYLEKLRLWDTVKDRVVPTANVRAALAALTNGSVDAAIVYESDTVGTDVQALVVAGSWAPAIIYPAAIVKTSHNREQAERFLAFLKGSVASEIFARCKFTPLNPH